MYVINFGWVHLFCSLRNNIMAIKVYDFIVCILVLILTVHWIHLAFYQCAFARAAHDPMLPASNDIFDYLHRGHTVQLLQPYWGPDAILCDYLVVAIVVIVVAAVVLVVVVVVVALLLIVIVCGLAIVKRYTCSSNNDRTIFDENALPFIINCCGTERALSLSVCLHVSRWRCSICLFIKCVPPTIS